MKKTKNDYTCYKIANSCKFPKNLHNLLLISFGNQLSYTRTDVVESGGDDLIYFCDNEGIISVICNHFQRNKSEDHDFVTSIQ